MTPLRAAWVVAVAAVAVRVAALGPARRLARLAAGPRGPVDPDRAARAVAAAGRRLPGAGTCLPQAVALEALVEGAVLRIGAAPGRRAHAWVELGDRVVLGGDVSEFRVLV